MKDIQETAEEVTKVIMDQIVNMTDGDFSRVSDCKIPAPPKPA